MTTISSANSSLLYAYGVSEQTKSLSQTVSNGISSSTDTLSEQTQSMYADDGNQKDTVSISTLNESFSHTSEGYWLPSENGGLGDFCTAGTTVNGVDAKDIPGAVAGTLSFSLTTGKAVAGTYSETGAGVESVKSFSISDNKGNISGSFTSIETKEIDSLFGIDENQGSNTQKLSNNKLAINA